jgi:hypothetical protein
MSVIMNNDRHYRDRAGRKHHVFFVGTLGVLDTAWASKHCRFNDKGFSDKDNSYDLVAEWTEQDTLAAKSAEAAALREEKGLDMGDPVALTGERKKTHGDWKTQAFATNELKLTLRAAPGWERMASWQQEALDMICTKMGRITCGDPNEPDHWDDIAGYAHLGKGGHS